MNHNEDTKAIEVICKIQEVGKITFTIETEKEINYLFRRLVRKGIDYLTKELEKEL